MSRRFREEEWEEVEPVHPTVQASDQVVEAMLHLDRHPDTLMRWPYPDLDTLTGPMGEGEVWFLCAFSGGGKTTFVCSCIEAWRRTGRRVYVMPLELQPFRFRTYLACMAVGVHPGDALSGTLRADPARAAERAVLKQALVDQAKEPYVERIMVSEQRRINVRGLETGLKEAKAFHADIVIVDHIDHIAGGNGTNLYAESCAVNDAALQMAQDNGMLLLFTSQLNMEIVKGDKLAKYQPPMPHHVMFPTAKLKNATGMLGLFRPVRSRTPGETDADYADTIKRARQGLSEPHHALEPSVMGVHAMKLRNYGQHEGRRVSLGFENGKVVHLPEKDRHSGIYGGTMV